MMRLLRRYARWLHTGWPGGTVEKLPLVEPDGRTNVPGLFIVGDLTGVPLLKFAADTGAAAAQLIASELASSQRGGDQNCLDLAIVGGGVSGASAALEAKKLGLNFAVFEASQSFSTLKNFPTGKAIFTYPTDMRHRGDLKFEHDFKEPLVTDLDAQLDSAGVVLRHGRIERVVRQAGRLHLYLNQGSHHGAQVIQAHRVIIAIGRSGEYRKLGVPGESLDKVSNRLHDPREYAGKKVLVVGGCDSALEAAVALTVAGANVLLSYRGADFTRPKPENVNMVQALLADPLANVGVSQPDSDRVTTAMTPQMLPPERPSGALKLAMNSNVTHIDAEQVTLDFGDGRRAKFENDAVFTMIGREPPLDFFRRCGVRIGGEWTIRMWLGLLAFFSFCVFIYHWKSYYWFPTPSFNPANWVNALRGALGDAASDKTSLLYTVLRSASGPSFYYTLLYSSAIAYFGFKRIRRRKTPYVRAQTLALMAFQWLPLFILPEIILPLMGRNGFFADGAILRSAADLFFETYDGGVGEERAYWRAYGFVLAWPLMVYNWFTDQPMMGWLVLGFLQTFVLIPLMIRRWGKGSFCGWVCSCGALAETLGDTHRHKMPHGPKWNRLNMLGQGILLLAFAMLFIRIGGWVWPESWANTTFNALLSGPSALTYKWAIDVALAGFLGVGFYFHYSGRVWCRFACPLAALMHIYTRFSRFRIFSDKKKCISCNVCTSQCHMGIDIMNFANKGLPMEDPECVRCSACVVSCPTGVLQFGRYGRDNQIVYDRTPASLVQMAEALNHGKAA